MVPRVVPIRFQLEPASVRGAIWRKCAIFWGSDIRRGGQLLLDRARIGLRRVSRGGGAARSLAIFALGGRPGRAIGRPASADPARSSSSSTRAGGMAVFCGFCGARRGMLEGRCWKGGLKRAAMRGFRQVALCLSGLGAARWQRRSISTWSTRRAGSIALADPLDPQRRRARSLAPSRARPAEFGSTFGLTALQGRAQPRQRRASIETRVPGRGRGGSGPITRRAQGVGGRDPSTSSG